MLRKNEGYNGRRLKDKEYWLDEDGWNGKGKRVNAGLYFYWPVGRLNETKLEQMYKKNKV